MTSLQPAHPAARQALIYVTLAALLNFLADSILTALMPNPSQVLPLRWSLVGVTVGVLYLVVYIDLKNRQRTEAQQRDTERRLANMLEVAADAILSMDERLLIQQFNPSAEKIFGYPATAVIGHSVDQLLPGSRSEHYHRYLLDFIEQADTARLLSDEADLYGRRADGSEFPLEASLSKLSRPQGVTLTIILRDITERKWADEALRAIVAGTAGNTGDDFFRSLVRHLASALQVRYAFVAECTDQTNTHVRTLAFWLGSDFGDNFDYALADTPCEQVIGGTICYHPERLRDLFPKDLDLVALRADSYLGIPLRDSAGNVIGHLAALNDGPMRDEPRGISILRVFATRAGAELERKRTVQQLERNAQQLATLNQMGQVVLASLDLEIVLWQVVEELRRLLGAQDVSVLLREGNELVFAAVGGANSDTLRHQRMPVEVGVAGQVLRTGQAVRVMCSPDSGPIYRELETLTGYKTQALLAVPLQLGQERIGVMEAVHSRANAFSDNDLHLLEAAASWATTAIDHARQHQRLQRRLRESELLATINQALNSTLDLDRVFQMIVEAVSRIIPQVKRAVIHVLDEHEQTLRPRAVAGHTEPHGVGLALRPGEGVAGLVMTEGIVINVHDTLTDQRYQPHGATSPMRSLLVAPVQSGPHRLGTLSAQSDTPNAFSTDDEQLLQLLGVQAGLAVEKVWLLKTEREQRELAEALRDAGTALSVTLDLEGVLDRVFDQIAHILPYDAANIRLTDGSLARPARQRGYENFDPQLAQHIHEQALEIATTECLRWMHDTQQPLIVSDIATMPGWVSPVLIKHLRSWAGAPVIVDGQVVAFFSLHKVEAGFYRREHAQRLQALAGQAALAWQNARLYTDLQAALEQEKATRAQLVQSGKLASMGHMIASVAHEINNPLQVIQNALYLLKKETHLSRMAHDYLQVAEGEADRMGGLIGRLRETYRPAASEDFRPEALNALVEHVKKLMDVHLRHNDVIFLFSPDPDLPLVWGLRDQLQQALLNLCLNAVEAMPVGGTLTVRTRHNTDRDEVWLSIHDTGVGIEPDALTHIFEPFVTTKNTGTGLGLAITHDIVRRHGGRIEVESDIGQGTTFTLCLPVLADPRDLPDTGPLKSLAQLSSELVTV